MRTRCRISNFDHIIVGHGLAGATLAIELRRRGLSVCVFDEGRSNTASRVAAGLMTPITGKRFALTPRWEELWPLAVDFYQEFAQKTGHGVLTRTPAVRFFRDAEDARWFEKRRDEMSAFIEEPGPADGFANEFSGVQMKDTGRLDVSRLLDVAADEIGNAFFTNDAVQGPAVQNEGDRIQLASVTGERLTWCTGYHAVSYTHLTLPTICSV